MFHNLRLKVLQQKRIFKSTTYFEYNTFFAQFKLTLQVIHLHFKYKSSNFDKQTTTKEETNKESSQSL
jgi:hypothetical protein